MKLSARLKLAGEGLAPLILIVALILIGVGWYLFSTKSATNRECRTFGHDIINRLVVNHDRAVLVNELSPEMKMKFPPSTQEYTIQRMAQLGMPHQPIRIEDNVTFETSLFGLISSNPHGFFTAHLDYPGQELLLQIAVSHPQTKWQVDDITGPAAAPHEAPAAAPPPPPTAVSPSAEPSGSPPP